MSTLFEQYLALKKTQSAQAVHQATPSMDTLPSTGEVLDRIFQEYLADLNRRTLQGLLGAANPTMLAQVQGAQTRIDKTWADCLAGRATLESFRGVVAQWHKVVIALFTPPQAQGVSQERLF